VNDGWRSLETVLGRHQQENNQHDEAGADLGAVADGPRRSNGPDHVDF